MNAVLFYPFDFIGGFSIFIQMVPLFHMNAAFLGFVICSPMIIFVSLIPRKSLLFFHANAEKKIL